MSTKRPRRLTAFFSSRLRGMPNRSARFRFLSSKESAASAAADSSAVASASSASAAAGSIDAATASMTGSAVSDAAPASAATSTTGSGSSTGAAAVAPSTGAVAVPNSSSSSRSCSRCASSALRPETSMPRLVSSSFRSDTFIFFTSSSDIVEKAVWCGSSVAVVAVLAPERMYAVGLLVVSPRRTLLANHRDRSPVASPIFRKTSGAPSVIRR
mmetsp:Transcript_46616/g.129975  ORF Transcript_46616/g.129975 Transcript_46616/m.129975 type:complete len:214 (-) Transcript_46616:84-725(-)